MSGGISEWIYGATVILALIIATIMFSDTLRGSMDMASAGMKYLYEKTTSSVLGQQYGLGPLTKEEMAYVVKGEKIQVGGLYNEGNTCFMNCVVQGIASCENLQEFLRNKYRTDNQEKEKSTEVSHKGRDNLRRSLLLLLEELNKKKDSYHAYSLSSLTREIADLTKWQFAQYAQGDAQEFFQQILLGMEKEMESQDIHLQKKLPNTPFDGMQATRVGCVKCGEMEGIRRGLLSSIDLALGPDTSGSITLEELFDETFRMEIIPDVECYRCSLIDYEQELGRRAKQDGTMSKLYASRAAQIQDALRAKVIDEKKYAELKPKKLKVLGDKTKQVMLAKPVADIMMIHINRSVFDMVSGYSGKNYTSVVFPMYLDISPWVISDDNSINEYPKYSMKGTPEDPLWYELKGSVIHYGSHNSGHYVCYRKDSQGFWWSANDDSVSFSSASQVQRSQGVFMLFYERYKGDPAELAAKQEIYMDENGEKIGENENDDNNDEYSDGKEEISTETDDLVELNGHQDTDSNNYVDNEF